jgi:arabinosaccharide transport system substrate-binding protein
MRSFPFGRAALWILILCLVSGVARAYFVAQAPKETATLTFWTFAKDHHDAYQSAFRSFEKAHPGTKIESQLVTWQAVTQRLQAAMWSGVKVPDIVEIPIDSAGSYFRGPVEGIGFVDLTDRIKEAGLLNSMVRARFAPYTSRDRIFGLPHDVHPVMLAYNDEILKKEGVDASKIQTWDEFAALGRKLTIPGKRYMMEFDESRSVHLEMLMFQRGGGMFDENGNVIFDNEIGVETTLWMVPLMAGPNKISNSVGLGPLLTKAVEDGLFIFLSCPDWRSKGFEKDIAKVKGKMKLMPLPAAKPGGRRTSTWGGTMLGITTQSPDVDLAWKLAKHLYLDEKELGQRFRDTNIIPALRSAWKQSEFDEKREYWSGQQVGNLYASLAPQAPPQNTSPFIAQGKSKLSEAFVECLGKYKRDGDKGFEPFVRARLKRSADELRAMIKRNPY